MYVCMKTRRLLSLLLALALVIGLLLSMGFTLPYFMELIRL